MASVRLSMDTGDEREIVIERTASGYADAMRVKVGDDAFDVEVHGRLGGRRWMRIAGRSLPFQAVRVADALHVWVDGCTYRFHEPKKSTGRSRHAAAAVSSNLKAPMPGTILRIEVATGDSFDAHQPLVVMESMKMEMTLSAPAAGTVGDVCCEVGQLVEMGALLIKVDAPDAPA